MSAQPEALSLGELRGRLAGLMLRDEVRLGRRLEGTRKAADHAAALEAVARDITAAEQRVAQRRASVPAISYPDQLPISQKRDEIAAAIRDHQVVVVAGETGSGKTTQIPKICLELGRGVTGLIGHTQPRRIAARAVADRVAEELGTELGDAVGYKIRFTDSSSDGTLVKVMTDGILLAEVQHDRELRQYDTLILDEAHERSLNIDFLLGYLKQLLPRRPDLKVVITSATIDPQRFAQHFDSAPVIEVSGRTFPVEVRYRPLVADSEDDSGDGEPRDQVSAIADAVDELCAEGPGDILVFLSGEREIRDTADALTGSVPPETEVLPLYGRLSAAEQHRVFERHTGRRVVLATNVAETSLTVPGIRYVVDPGTARISRYSRRTKVQRLPIEAISQASATQRAGRCGRVEAGVCIRLYSEEDLAGRPEFTEPEILRTNLASVILSMTSLGLGDIAAFPFVEPPDAPSIKDGVDLLEELGALEPSARGERKRLTPMGRQLAQLPVDPRLARMLIEAGRNGCVPEVLVLVSALSIQDPRERPTDKQQAADEMHARFKDERSDFLAYLNLWEHIREQQRELSSSAFRRMCKREFLSWLRVREWQDLHGQLRRIAAGLDLPVDTTPADAQRIHTSLLSGLLSHIGMRDPDKREYAGARGVRFAVNPGSVLFRKQPRFVMVSELVETTRLWGRVAARIEPEWAEALAPHLVARFYSEPHWEKRRAATVAYERVTLYGVPLVVRRKVDYGRIDPELSRELFIRHGLVDGDWDTHHAFLTENRMLLEEVEDLEHRARRRDLLVDDETLFSFYDKHIPPDVVSARHFDAWWKTARRETPDLLSFSAQLLVNDQAAGIRRSDYPDVWVQGDLRLPLTYQFEPGSDADGVTVHVPLAVLNRVTPGGFDWQVPGLRQELVTALIRSLPKHVRVKLVPAPDTAAAVLARVSPGPRALTDVLEDELSHHARVDVPHGSWQLDRVPDHLRMTFRVEQDGRTVGEGKDLDALKEQLRAPMTQAVSQAAAGLERTGLRSWTVGTVPRVVRDGAVEGYPALVDQRESVALRVLGTAAEQEQAHALGVRRLLLLGLPSPARTVAGRLSNAAKLALTANPHGSVAALLEDCTTCALDALVADAGGPVWDENGFAGLLAAVRGRLDDAVLTTVTRVQEVLAAATAVTARLDSEQRTSLAPSVGDLRAQLAGLVHAGFATETGYARLADLPRYLKAMAVRLDKLPYDWERDRLRTADVHAVEAELRTTVERLPAARRDSAAVREVRWMVEELRVSLFAQTVRAAGPVSEKRIYRALDDLLT
jgi:ATP-dependent helicase HrpA